MKRFADRFAEAADKPFYDLDAMAGIDDDDPDGARAWDAMRLMQHIRRFG